MIRRAGARDAAIISRLHCETVLATRLDAVALVDLVAWAAPRGLAFYRKLIAEEHVVVFEDDGADLVGFGVCSGQPRVVDAVYVPPEKARLDAARELVAAVEVAAVGIGRSDVRFDAACGCVPFYSALGYRQWGGSEICAREAKRPFMVMAKSLGRPSARGLPTSRPFGA